jgi:hypothetical protein
MKEKQEEEIKQHKERLTSMESEKHKGAGLVSLVQEHKVKTLTSQLEVREAQLNHILSTCHADPNEASDSCKKLEVKSTIIYFWKYKTIDAMLLVEGHNEEKGCSNF